MSLITETNAQYYAGQQAFVGAGTAGPVITTFNTDLVSYLNNAPTSNFSVLVNNVLLVEGTDYSLTGANTITFLAGSFPAVGASIIVQLNQTAKNNKKIWKITSSQSMNSILIQS